MSRWKNFSYWKYFFDIFTVFLGVMLAFMANNWKDDWHNRQLRQQYWTNFFQEITANQQEMDSVIAINQQRVQQMQRLVQVMQNTPTLSKDSLHTILNLLTRVNMIQLRTATYEAAKNSGIWHLFTNQAIMIQLVQYYQKVEEVQWMQEIFLRFFNQQTIPYLQKHVDFLSLNVKHNLLQEVEFRNIFIVQYTLLDQLVNQYRELQQLGKQILNQTTSSTVS